jgi:integral membrane sensor domain MASE1
VELRLFQTVAALGSVILTLVVLELIRRRKLSEELWIPWLVVALAPGVAALWIWPWATLARWLGIFYEPALLLGLAVVLSISILLYVTVVVSSIVARTRRLAQEVAILRAELKREKSPAG